MIDYLKKYNLKNDDIAEIKKVFNKDIITKFEIMENIVCKNLDYLLELGLVNFKMLILTRPDLCFSDLSFLQERFSKFDKKLILFIIENDPQNLINLDI